MASEKTMATLSLELDAKTAQLNKKTDEVNRRLSRMEKQNASFAKNLKGNFLMITGAVAGFSGALKLTKDILNSTQTTGDKVTHMTAGLKQGLESVFENIATLDIKEIGKDWQNAYQAAHIYSQVLDDIGDQSLAISIRRAEGMAEIAREKWQEEKALAAEQYDVALEHSNKIKKINEDLLERENSLLTQRLEAWRDNVARKEDANKDEIEGLMDLIRNYDLYAKELQKVQSLKDLEAVGDGKRFWAGRQIGWVGPTKEQRAEAAEAAKEQVQHLDVLEKGIYDVWEIYDKLTDTQRKELGDIMTESALLQKKNLNLLASQETKEKSILALKQKQVEAEKDENKELKISLSPGPVSIGNMANPIMNSRDNNLGAFLPPIAPLQEFNDGLEESQKLVTSLQFAFGGLFSMLSQSIAEGAADWQSFAISAIDAIGGVINMLLAQFVAQIAVKNAAMGPWGWIAGLVGAGIGLAALKGLIAKSRDNSFTDGGIVPGTSYTGDYVPSYLNSGEMVLKGSQQANLWNAIKTGSFGNSGQWETADLRFGYDALYMAVQKGAKNHRRG